jgi:dihydroorotase
MTTIEIPRPDDWHLHLRDGEALRAVLPHTARQFARAIVMPNLRTPVTTTAQAQAYRERILAALPAGLEFAPLMTLYLTDTTPPEEVLRARESGVVHGIKLYRRARRPTRRRACAGWPGWHLSSRPCRRAGCRCWCTGR